MGPLGTVSRFVAESLRGMKGVVASSSMGWGVARFMLVVAARESIYGCCVELGENQAVAAACLTSSWKASGGSGLIFYGTAGDLLA